MTANSFSERDGQLFLRLRQQKTQALVEMPLHNRLVGPIRERLAEMQSAPAAQTLIASPRGLAWGYRNFSRSFGMPPEGRQA